MSSLDILASGIVKSPMENLITNGNVWCSADEPHLVPCERGRRFIKQWTEKGSLVENVIFKDFVVQLLH